MSTVPIPAQTTEFLQKVHFALLNRNLLIWASLKRQTFRTVHFIQCLIIHVNISLIYEIVYRMNWTKDFMFKEAVHRMSLTKVWRSGNAEINIFPYIEFILSLANLPDLNT